MKNRLFYYQLLDEREEQLMNKAGAETFHISIGLLFLTYLIAVLAPSLFNPSMLLVIIIIWDFLLFQPCSQSGCDLL